MERFARYLVSLAHANGLRGEVSWLFYPGMLQESFDKWWDDFGTRPTAHEGVDICFFREDKKNCCLAKDALIPAMDKGVILNRCKDFLGESLVIAHDCFNHFSTRVLFVYSHLAIEKELLPGCRIEKGQIIAKVFDTSQKRSRLLPHLHLSCIELMGDTRQDALDWNLFSDRKKINLINPIFI